MNAICVCDCVWFFVKFTQYNHFSVESRVERLIAFEGSQYEPFHNEPQRRCDSILFLCIMTYNSKSYLFFTLNLVFFFFHLFVNNSFSQALERGTSSIFVLYSQSWRTLDDCTSQISLTSEIVVTNDKQHKKKTLKCQHGFLVVAKSVQYVRNLFMIRLVSSMPKKYFRFLCVTLSHTHQTFTHLLLKSLLNSPMF